MMNSYSHLQMVQQNPVVLLERNLNGHPSAGLLWERQLEEALFVLGREKVPNWECMVVRRKQGLFFVSIKCGN